MLHIACRTFATGRGTISSIIENPIAVAAFSLNFTSRMWGRPIGTSQIDGEQDTRLTHVEEKEFWWLPPPLNCCWRLPWYNGRLCWEFGLPCCDHEFTGT